MRRRHSNMLSILVISFFSYLCIHSVQSISQIYTCDRTNSCGCSTITPVSILSKIVGGELTPDRAWGWMVSLQFDEIHFCGATLISADFAVTAAHCVQSALSKLKRYSILTGTNYLNDTNNELIQQRHLTTIKIHPDYDSTTLSNDIALLYFNSLIIDENSTLSFICLPEQNHDPFSSGTNLIGIGWGVEAFGDVNFSNALRQVTIQAIDSNAEQCQRMRIDNATQKFCAGVLNGGKDTCKGDSGGPLMSFVNNRWLIVGITSSGYECAKKDIPALYTRVSTYVSFIQQSMASIISSEKNSTTLPVNPALHLMNTGNKIIVVGFQSFAAVLLYEMIVTMIL